MRTGKTRTDQSHHRKQLWTGISKLQLLNQPTTMIDLRRILVEHWDNPTNNEQPLFTERDALNAMKAAIRESIPVILDHCAEYANVHLIHREPQDDPPTVILVNKDSITNQKDELIKLLGV